MKKYLVFLIAVLSLSGCGSNTSIVNSWRDPDVTVAQEEFKKVLVVALVKDEASRRITENRIAASNLIFKTSYQYLNATSQLTQEQKLKILQDENFDGVVTMRLVAKKKKPITYLELIPECITEDLTECIQECTVMALATGTECILQISMIPDIIRKQHRIWLKPIFFH